MKIVKESLGIFQPKNIDDFSETQIKIHDAINFLKGKGIKSRAIEDNGVHILSYGSLSLRKSGSTP